MTITPRNPRLNRHVTLFKALGHPSRLWMVLRLQDGPRSVRELQAGLDQDLSTVSRHLLVLRNAGLVRFEKRGRQSLYEWNSGELSDLLDVAGKMRISPRQALPDD